MGVNTIVTGIVLSVIPVGDYDKRITILTKERGKISAFVKGAKRPGSSLMAPSCPFVFGEFELFAGKNSYNVSKANVKDYHRDIINDLDKVYYGCYFLEVTQYYTQENNDETDMLNLLYITLKALSKGNIPYRLIRRIFELKVLGINGEYPGVFNCAFCNGIDNLNGISYKKKGCVCDKCINKSPDYIKISNGALYTIQYVLSSDIGKLYTFKLSDEVCDEFERIVNHFFGEHSDKNFKSLEFIS